MAKKDDRKVFESTVGKLNLMSKVSVAESRGRVEVVFEYKGQRCRLLGDKDGIHVGTVVSG